MPSKLVPLSISTLYLAMCLKNMLYSIFLYITTKMRKSVIHCKEEIEMIETTEKISMNYGTIRALDGIHFTITRGEVVGLVGPNGAGKSTTLKIITSYIYPTQGTVYIDKKDVRSDYLATRKMIGYLPEQLPLYTDMEVREYLKFVGNARGIYGRKLTARIEWVKDKCGLTPVFYRIIRELSKGYRQRTALAQSLIHDPSIVILDEPTSGLDPQQILEIRHLIGELEREQKTVIFSSHILQEVEAVARRLLIINSGKIIADGNLQELQTMAQNHTCCELILFPDHPTSEVQETLNKLHEVAQISAVSQNEAVNYTVQGKPGQDLRRALATLVQQKKWNFLELKTKPITLEQVFLNLTKSV